MCIRDSRESHTAASSLALKMPEHGQRLVHHPITRPDGSHAQIRVVVIDGKLLIEPSQFEEDLAPNRQTCSSDGGDVARQVQPSPISRAVTSPAGVGAAISDADRNAAMLQGPGAVSYTHLRAH